MGLFSSDAVKHLRAEAETIATLVAMDALGEAPAGTADEVVHSESFSERLTAAYEQAAIELGHEKAFKKALKFADGPAKAIAYHRDRSRETEVGRRAEAVVEEMLASHVQSHRST
ncbi:MAG TPA: hypothetical protein VMU32_02125 [Solirubrobacteraceae bacterium]|nr:hypothetical protein [Solirubrobacteraceae bacterium]